MYHYKFIKVLGNAFKFYTVLALAVLLFQLVGLIMYYINVWPGIKENLSAGIASFVILAVFLLLIRSSIWIWIYWYGSQSFFILHRDRESPKMADNLIPKLKALTRMLILSCILELCFVPILLMSDSLLPFQVTGLWLAIIDIALILFPQAFGIGALVLAFLTHHYGQLLMERSQLKEDLELTI